MLVLFGKEAQDVRNLILSLFLAQLFEIVFILFDIFLIDFYSIFWSVGRTQFSRDDDVWYDIFGKNLKKDNESRLELLVEKKKKEEEKDKKKAHKFKNGNLQKHTHTHTMKVMLVQSKRRKSSRNVSS